MTKTIYTSDVEADGLLDTITKFWCCSWTRLDSRMNPVESKTLTGIKEIAEFFGNPDNILVMHNGIGYDGPAVTKVLGIKVQAEIVDTLFMSWHMYPREQKHGLATWGEKLGVPKPPVDDWENLALEDYIHRCQEDVKIQTLLWQQMWKHLMLLYGNEEGCWHLIRHLNFKAKCAAMQTKSRWKLDVDKAQAMFDDFTAKHEEARDALSKLMPDVPVYAKREPPKKPFKMNGQLSSSGIKWVERVKGFVDKADYDPENPVEYREVIKERTGWAAPNAGSHVQLKKWLHLLGWIPETFEHKRNKETNEVKIISKVKDPDTGDLCPSIERMIKDTPDLAYLREMSILAHRAVVISGFLRNLDEDGYVVAAVQGLTNTLRFKHKICVNLPSARKPYGLDLRSLLITQGPTTELCGSDMSSLEDRTKQHYMWKHDPEYVKEMQSDGFDPHLDMAIAASLLTPKDVIAYKDYDKDNHTEAEAKEHFRLAGVRHGGKSTNYAATYGAKGPTIARAAGVDDSIGELLYEAYWVRNWSLVAIADECIVKNSRGMKWLWNPVAKIWFWLKAEKDRFSTLNQGTGTYAFDRWLYHIVERRPQLTAQFHDEGIWELKKGNRPAMDKILRGAMADVNKELQLNRELDCDIEYGDNYGEIH